MGPVTGAVLQQFRFARQAETDVLHSQAALAYDGQQYKWALQLLENTDSFV